MHTERVREARSMATNSEANQNLYLVASYAEGITKVCHLNSPLLKHVNNNTPDCLTLLIDFPDSVSLYGNSMIMVCTVQPEVPIGTGHFTVDIAFSNFQQFFSIHFSVRSCLRNLP